MEKSFKGAKSTRKGKAKISAWPIKILVDPLARKKSASGQEWAHVQYPDETWAISLCFDFPNTSPAIRVV
jgi:hypothetical protein